MISVSGKIWTEQKVNQNLVEKFKQDYGLSDILSKLIISRNYDSSEIYGIDNKQKLINIFKDDKDFQIASLILLKAINDNEKDIIEARSMGITDLNKKYELNEIIKGDSLFCASGITTSEVLNGIIIDGDKFISETLVTHKNTNFREIVKSINLINE